MVMQHWHLCHLFLQIKRVNSEAYKKTFEEIVRNIDKMENECIPSVTLAKQEVKTGSVTLPSHHGPLTNSLNEPPLLKLCIDLKLGA